MPSFSRAVQMSVDLVRCPSVTPKEAGALDYIEAWLRPYGFRIKRLTFSDPTSYDVENLYACIGEGEPNLMFAGHTDVVPPGDENLWRFPPFAAEIAEGRLWGRGAADMKSGVAAALAAVLDYLDEFGAPKKGSISFLITGDEEADAVNGTVKTLEWMREQGEPFGACIVGEPTCPKNMGEMLKIGRRGSLSGELIVEGVQGHVAYPERAVNPIDGLMRLLPLLQTPLDHGTPHFSPSNLEFTSIDVGNRAKNVIPAQAKAAFNIRFNDLWGAASLEAELRTRLSQLENPPNYRFVFYKSNAPAFLTPVSVFTSQVVEAVAAVTGRKPELSTSGGTSDARFIQAYAAVIECGLVGETIHKVDENVKIEEIDQLTAIYHRLVLRYFGHEV